MSLESALEVGFGAAALVVYAAGAATLARAVSSGRSLLTRARTLVPMRVREQMHAARADARRALASLPRLLPILRRAIAAKASIAASLASATEQLHRMRAALRQVVFRRFPGPNGRSRP